MSVMSCVEVENQQGSLFNRIASVKNSYAILGGLDDKQLHELIRHVDIVDYPSRKLIFSQGDLPSDIFIILKGHVILSTITDVGSQCDELLIPGNVFGETSVIGVQTQVADAVTLHDVELMRISRVKLMALLEIDPRLFAILMMNVARHASRKLHNNILNAHAEIAKGPLQ